jgi:tRNA threonylcarbamoyladenosine biosynthesis protein TsaB
VLILALDTTTRAGSVAVVRDDVVVSMIPGEAARTHGERLPGELERALADAGISIRELDLLVVASGPGAFTGLRIGLAAMQGLAMVSGVPVVGVSALDALADATWPQIDGPVGERRLIVWMDAQRGEVFESRYTASSDGAWIADADPRVGLPQALLSSLAASAWRSAAVVGDGAMRYRETIHTWSTAARIVATPPALAPALARIGRRLAERGRAGPPHALQPLYVRRPDAELERERRTEPA